MDARPRVSRTADPGLAIPFYTGAPAGRGKESRGVPVFAWAPLPRSYGAL